MSEVGLNKPDISILSEEFLEFKMRHKNVAVELLRRLIEGKLRMIARKTIVQSRKFSEILMKHYQVSSTLLTQLLLFRINRAAKEVQTANISKDSGLSEDEYAFYEALASNAAKE